MLTLITEKLRSQKLEDAQFEPIPKCERASWETTPTPNWPRFTTKEVSDSEPTFSTSRRVSLNSTLVADPLLEEEISTRGRESLPIPLISSTFSYDGLSCTPPAPPLKRHCRSLSIPTDLSDTPLLWQPQPSNIWKPVKHHLRDKHKRNSPSGFPHKHRHSSGPGGLSYRSNSPCLRSRLSQSSNDSLPTPPESPIPRPASACGGTPWWENLNAPRVTLRSLSMEESISSCRNNNHSGSMPAINGSCSMPSSPRRYRVLRCRSQPCDLQDRKCGVKRRRNDERPMLNFLKMKETAYERCHGAGSCGFTRTVSRPRNVQFSEQVNENRRMLPSILSEPPECFLGLNTIASSPLDTTLPALAVTTHFTPGSATVQSENASHPGLDDWEEVEGATVYGTTLLPPSGDDSDDSEHSCHGDVPLFHLDINNEIDLEQIEND